MLKMDSQLRCAAEDGEVTASNGRKDTMENARRGPNLSRHPGSNQASIKIRPGSVKGVLRLQELQLEDLSNVKFANVW